jgi:YHS domain-containing protein
VTYLFSNAEAKAMFDKDPDTAIAKAETAWPNIR